MTQNSSFLSQNDLASLPRKGNVVSTDSLSTWLARPKKNFVDGKFVDEAETFDTVDPASNQRIAKIELASRALVTRAVAGARKAFDDGAWSGMELKDRCALLKRLGDRILENRATLAVLETLDTGKPIQESFDGDIPRAAANFHFYSEYAPAESEPVFRSQGRMHLAFREPLGVALLITPWNLPLYLATWKLAPALAMGNSVILKPSELTPLTASFFSELCADVGLPPGVFQCLNGFGEDSVGEWLVAEPGIDAISFTGETSTGRAIMAQAARGPTKVSFELGGKGASIIFADADIAKAVSTSIRAGFRNQGEVCLAAPRLFVEDAIYEQVAEAFVAEARKIRVGNPLDLSTTMGALINETHYQKVNSYLVDLIPGNILLGGGRPELEPPWDRGNFLLPTVLAGIPLSHRVSCEEIFGPVVALYRFSKEDDVLQWANATPYGLSASVWTQDLNRAMRVGKRLRKGMVWVNDWFVRDLRAPFGGQKKSGLGREGGKYSMDFFSEWKSLCLPM